MRIGWLFLVGVAFVSLVGFAQTSPSAVLLWRSDTLLTWSRNVQTLVGVGDVTGDGIPDIICDQDGLIYYPGRGDGAFGVDSVTFFYEQVLDEEASTPTVKVYQPITSFLTQCGALGDFDNDNDLDLDMRWRTCTSLGANLC